MERLSTAEFEIAERICLGESKKEVAFRTNRSVYTVETTIKNVYAKLGINKLSDLVLWYCGDIFKIANQIKDKQNKVLKIGILILLTSLSPMNSYGQRRNYNRRANYTLTLNRMHSRRRKINL